ncbi:DUF4249 domain-containing protein [Parapedobacter koreensis]|uniref:DUF4249 domain-containing protein n=1 Tax=Parapedobacter koreensis TaxID=332977 RepID=A0A1H7MRI4_9SPHI|nr:DUF4249 domain-containing protein [Parapedobacter koreensis]SEL13852.1 protein of unknown function [Parapedobacter koreensis]
MNTYPFLKRSSSLLCLVLLVVSCEKEIDIQLDGVEKKYVIEGTVTDQEGGSQVWVSRTKDFAEDNSRTGVSGAIVEISDGNTSYTLQEDENGHYTAPALIGTSGTTYHLSVRIGTEQFSASSNMPQKVSMDSLYTRQEFLFDEMENLPTIDFSDPAGERNYYRFVLYVNDIKKRDIFAYDDDMIDGNSQSISLFYLGDGEEDDDPRNDKIKSGDLVRVQMLCTDAAVYKYFYSLSSSATGNPNGAAPANPVSNLQGGALGYFSAHTVQQQETRVP